MAENLDFGTYVANGVGVNQSDASSEAAQKFCMMNSATACETMGGLYQWHTAMGLPLSCNTALSGSAPCLVTTPHQGICPTAWHVPTAAEWLTLDSLVDNENGGAVNDEGQSLKSTTGWEYDVPGNGTNSTGFDAYPSGNSSGRSFYAQVLNSFWWSTAERSSTEAYVLSLGVDMAYLYQTFFSKNNSGFSLRCVRD